MEKLKLFQDENDDDDQIEDGGFAIRESSLYEDPRKTEKLIKLKSRLAHDQRFQVDERFIDDDDEDLESETNRKVKSEIDLEKEKNLQILEQVLQKPIFSHKPKQETPRITLFTPRFDPTKEETNIYEERRDDPKGKKRKLPLIDMDAIDRKLEIDKKQSLEEKVKNLQLDQTYYEVKSNLKDLFGGQTEDFTLGLGAETEESLVVPEQAINKSETKIEKQRPVPQKWFGNENQDKMETEEEMIDKIRITLSENERSEKFQFFFRNPDDRRLTGAEDQFYSNESVRKAIDNCQRRQLMMIRALSLRKRSSKKNRRTAEKYTLKQKIHKKFVVMNSKRRKLKLKKRGRRFNVRKPNKSSIMKTKK